MASKNDKLSGIYIIEDEKSKFVYVGKSTGVGVALRSAKSKLNKGIHHNKRMQDTYSEDSSKFKFYVEGIKGDLEEGVEDKMDEFLSMDDWGLWNKVTYFDLPSKDIEIDKHGMDDLEDDELRVIQRLIDFFKENADSDLEINVNEISMLLLSKGI